jgi:hypothetical protein
MKLRLVAVFAILAFGCVLAGIFSAAMYQERQWRRQCFAMFSRVTTARDTALIAAQGSCARFIEEGK